MRDLQRRAVARLAPHLELLTELGRVFTAAGHELALVGGPVRDAFLGRRTSDLDLTTSASPEQTEALVRPWGEAVWDIGRAFGTIGVLKDGDKVEITTYRADAYDGQTRKPVVAFGSSLTEDLVRRDFTVNAMALRLPDLEFVDPYDGLRALAERTLDTPTAPEVSFADDPLRMLRAARFTAQLDFRVAPRVETAMRERASTIEIVSAERIRDELSKLVLADNPRPGLALLVDTGLAELVLPELPALQLEIDEHHRHKDVYQHSLTVLEQAMALEGPRSVPGVETVEPVPGPDLVLRLAALLHDIGKPATRRFESGGGVSFHHHEVVGAKLARKRLRALRFDKDTIRDVCRLIELHLRFHGYGEGQWTDSAVRRYITDAGPLLSRLHLLTRSDSTTRNRRKAARLASTYDELEARIEKLQAAEELGKVRPELDGNRIGEILGIPPGPVLGRAYQHLLAFRLDQGPVGEDAAREELLRWWAEQPESGQ
ncbi:CCA tRNA nucleotidyltransferase [Calidifontibacter sp. DB0510]|uniref:CCA tRNA nucleotidyltransferase n=1 Tax=Metallococcus carri TaxID=1656884 RepID=A0A967B7L0_9MICO|nr:CCA tRNA nucleotidyltransferase [Metallococcus carri]NHN56216.1 CCA tRNA nucleotidyltransferase [Metallococcus carri]NOP38733.1 CCA tRNA nucleotidyltransferase [Calidifontibacter sp. DB2511S]